MQRFPESSSNGKSKCKGPEVGVCLNKVRWLLEKSE
jgi:hypothetical protein